DVFKHGGRVAGPNVTAEEVAAVLERSHALFYLEKYGDRRLTSATGRPELLGAALKCREFPKQASSGDVIKVAGTACNTGSSTWLAVPRPLGGYVTLGVKILERGGRLLDDTRGRTLLPRDILPGETIDMTVEVPLSGLGPGVYRIIVDLVNENVCWFQG